MTVAHRDPASYEEHAYSVPAISYKRDSWRDSAACRQVDTEIFFPVGRGASADIEQAKAVCARCPVQLSCLAFAVTSNQEYGIWGGCDEDELRLLRRRWHTVSAVSRREDR